LISQITDGLEYLYARGQIHGNLQSTNVYLDAARHPYLSGFGISQPPGSAQNPYFSPEQIEGGVVDQRTDVYALGVLLYELLTGVTPPVGIVAKPSAIRPDIPEAIDRIVLKALAQNPAQRFQSPAELKNTLQNSVLPMHAEPVSTPAPAPGVSQSVNVQQPTKSTNWTAIILVVLLVAVLIGAAFLIIPPLLQDDEVVDVIPTQLPVEQPTEPPAEPPTELPTEPPDVEPTEPDAGFPPEDLPDFCNSIGFAAGIAAFGIAFTYKKRKRDI
ncbi:MAG: protein kinase, partial [Chloroflexota bacterium]|nr:protein kinase [Chloroflexota bacterium]